MGNLHRSFFKIKYTPKLSSLTTTTNLSVDFFSLSTEMFHFLKNLILLWKRVA